MRNSKFITSAVLIGFLLAFVAGCQYEEVLPVLPDPGVQISFATDIIPIFNQSCSTTGCHVTGGTKPDLTAANAYEALANGNFIDKLTAENSLLYQWMNGEKGLAMPPSGVNPNYNAKVLLWIQQGAKNN